MAVINTWKRYSQLQEIHEHVRSTDTITVSTSDTTPSSLTPWLSLIECSSLRTPADLTRIRASLPRGTLHQPPISIESGIDWTIEPTIECHDARVRCDGSWPASLFTDRLDAQSLSDRRIQLELWLQRIINLPLVLQSSFFHSSLDLSETQSKQLYDVGRWLRSLERQVMLASRFDSVLNMHRLRVRMTTDFEHAQTFIAKGLSHLLYERPIVFGLPLPSRGSVVYGPDGLPVCSTSPRCNDSHSTIADTANRLRPWRVVCVVVHSSACDVVRRPDCIDHSRALQHEPGADRDHRG